MTGHKVRTTLNDELLEDVDEAELLDLQRQGLVRELDSRKYEASAEHPLAEKGPARSGQTGD